MNENAGKELEQLKMKNQKLTQESEQQSAMIDDVLKDIGQKTAQLKVSSRRCILPAGSFQ